MFLSLYPTLKSLDKRDRRPRGTEAEEERRREESDRTIVQITQRRQEKACKKLTTSQDGRSWDHDLHHVWHFRPSEGESISQLYLTFLSLSHPVRWRCAPPLLSSLTGPGDILVCLHVRGRSLSLALSLFGLLPIYRCSP
ncbi:hypothetical protein J4Q44_G00145020 [Coregonus suidteri]|uniref:Uncharacterized protein n=1 Tax=Coregonus suidteri TaxID=861788 RepID=A0AAN8QY19_9TELE